MTVKAKSKLEETFWLHLRVDGLQKYFSREYRFHPTRQWRFDFVDTNKMIAVEVEGGTYSNGRHTRGKGFHDDCRKYNEAVRLGWQVYRFDSKMVNSGHAIDYIKKVYNK